MSIAVAGQSDRVVSSCFVIVDNERPYVLVTITDPLLNMAIQAKIGANEAMCLGAALERDGTRIRESEEAYKAEMRSEE